MLAFTEIQLLELRQAAGAAYLEFLHEPSLSAGVYHLAAGGEDPQQPHTEDEVYVVLHGQAHIRVGAEEQAVAPGSIIFVAANVPHAFHSITADLDVLVLFAPAEYSRRAA